MAKVKVGEVSVHGIMWDVSYNWDSGLFSADAPGWATVTSPERGQVDQRIRDAMGTAKVRVSVPYVRIAESGSGYRVIEGTATGIHAGTRQILATEDGKARKLDCTASRYEYYEPMSEADSRLLLIMLAQIRELREQVNTIQERYMFPAGLRARVENEVTAARARLENKPAAEPAAEEMR